jgi:hypothetical protein
MQKLLPVPSFTLFLFTLQANAEAIGYDALSRQTHDETCRTMGHGRLRQREKENRCA